MSRRSGNFIRTRASSSSSAKPKILEHKNGRVSASLEFIHVQKGFNVRGDTDPDSELVNSVAEQGVLIPIQVRWKNKKEDALYIIDGERRYKAAKKAKWTEVPVVCRGHVDDKDALVVSLSTNEGQKPLKREERAEGFKRLRDAGLEEKEIADVIGCSERMVSETLRLVDKATGPIRRAAIGHNSKASPEDKIPVRAAARAASLPTKEQKKLAVKMKGKTTEEALEEVRKVEDRLGVVQRGRQAKKSAVKPKLNLKEMVDLVERRLKSALRHTPNSRTVQAQLNIIKVLKGELDIGEALPSSGRKKAVTAQKAPAKKKVKKTVKKAKKK